MLALVSTEISPRRIDSNVIDADSASQYTVIGDWSNLPSSDNAKSVNGP